MANSVGDADDASEAADSGGLVDGLEGRGHNPASRHHSGVALAVAVAVCRDQHCRYSQLVSQKRSHAYTRPICGWLLNRWTS